MPVKITWLDAMHNWHSGYRGICMVRFTNDGKILDKTGFWGWIVAGQLGNLVGLTDQIGVIAFRITTHWLKISLVGIIANSSAVVEKDESGALKSIRRIGPVGERAGLDSAICEGLGVK